MPLVISIVFAFALFCIETSAVMVAPLEFELANYFGVSISKIGYLVSVFAISSSVFGIMLNLLLFKFSKKKILMLMIIVFLVGNILAGLSESYLMMVIARIISGSSFVMIIGFGLNITMNLATKENHGKVASIILSGFLFAPAFGIPLVNFASNYLDWRYLFHIVSFILFLSLIFVILKVPNMKTEAPKLKDEFISFKSIHLWMAYLSILFLLSAVFAGYSYLMPIYENLFSIPAYYMPILFFLYGVAMVIGNFIVGRLCGKHTISVQIVGFFALGLCFVIFALTKGNFIFAFICTIGMGLFGLALNPATVTRIARTSNNSGFVNIFIPVVANIGITSGSYFGGLGIEKGFGLTSPLLVGAIFAFLAFLSVLPYAKSKI